jgi:hypothetical protein
LALLLSRSHKVVNLSKIDAAMAQEVVRGNEVKEEVGQRMVLQISFTRHGSGLISAYWKSDVRGLMPVEGVDR